MHKETTTRDHLSLTANDGALLICIPSAPLSPGCRVVIYDSNDLRIHLVGTCVALSGSPTNRTVQVHIEGGEGDEAVREFSDGTVRVATVVTRIGRGDAAPPAQARSTFDKRRFS